MSKAVFTKIEIESAKRDGDNIVVVAQEYWDGVALAHRTVAQVTLLGAVVVSGRAAEVEVAAAVLAGVGR